MFRKVYFNSSNINYPFKNLFKISMKTVLKSANYVKIQKVVIIIVIKMLFNAYQ